MFAPIPRFSSRTCSCSAGDSSLRSSEAAGRSRRAAPRRKSRTEEREKVELMLLRRPKRSEWKRRESERKGVQTCSQAGERTKEVGFVHVVGLRPRPISTQFSPRATFCVLPSNPTQPRSVDPANGRLPPLPLLPLAAPPPSPDSTPAAQQLGSSDSGLIRCTVDGHIGRLVEKAPGSELALQPEPGT